VPYKTREQLGQQGQGQGQDCSVEAYHIKRWR